MTKKLTPAPAPDAPSAELDLAQLLVKLIQNQDSRNDAIVAAIKDALTPKSQGIDEAYLADPRNRVQRLKNPTFQNAYEVNPAGLSDTIIDKLYELKPGKYLSGVVRVIVEESPIGDPTDKKTFILYKNKTPDQRMHLQQYFSSFTDMVEKIYAEQSARDAEDQVLKDAIAAIKAAKTSKQ